MKCRVYEEGLKEPFWPVKEPEPMEKSWESEAGKEMGWAVAIAEGGRGLILRMGGRLVQEVVRRWRGSDGDEVLGSGDV